MTNIYAKQSASSDVDEMTVDDILDLNAKSMKDMATEICSFTASVKNSPAFYKSRRKELQTMIEQLGDPSIFGTHSHADTYCPYLADYIVTWASLKDSDHDPTVEGLTETEKYKRKLDNVKRFPHLVSEFFVIKTKLYLEHVAMPILGATAYWLRYEWQNRGSVHVHYFLWLDEAPDLTYLHRLADKSIDELKTRNPEPTEAQIDTMVALLT